jgi:hypothetical protein
VAIGADAGTDEFEEVEVLWAAYEIDVTVLSDSAADEDAEERAVVIEGSKSTAP